MLNNIQLVPMVTVTSRTSLRLRYHGISGDTAGWRLNVDSLFYVWYEISSFEAQYTAGA